MQRLLGHPSLKAIQVPQACVKLSQWRVLAWRGPAAAGTKAAAFFRRSHGPTSYLRRRQFRGWSPWKVGRLANGLSCRDVKEAEHFGITAFSETRWAVAARAYALSHWEFAPLGTGIFRPIREAVACVLGQIGGLGLPPMMGIDFVSLCVALGRRRIDAPVEDYRGRRRIAACKPWSMPEIWARAVTCRYLRCGVRITRARSGASPGNYYSEDAQHDSFRLGRFLLGNIL